jgi:protein TIF31
MLEESLTQLEQESKSSSHDCIRWELGACWVQQLQTQAVAEKEAAEGKAKEGANGPSAGSEKTLKASLVPDLNRKQDNISKDEGENIAHRPSLLCFPISSVCHLSFDFPH